MAKKKKRTWFSLIKRFFISEPQSRLEKDKRKRWVSRLVRMKERERLAWETPEQSNNNSALPVIIAIDNAPPVGPIQIEAQSVHQRRDSKKSVEGNSCQHEILVFRHQAATKIQAAFRGYLARKALRALKGVVKLQAVIRGWAVRQQAINTLKCLQSIVNIQSEVCSKRREKIKDSSYFREKDVRVDLNSQRKWEYSTLTKEELKSLFLTKREASIKRERVKEYYLNHRRSAETERDKVHGRQRYWLEQWVDAQLAKSDTLDRNLPANARNRDNVRHLPKQHEAQVSESHAYIPRRSYHHRKQCSIGDDNNAFPGSPAYMASNESAKAKARSLSSPRLRPLSFDFCSEITSPYKHKLSPISSINSELTGSSWIQKGPIKSTMSVKDLRIRGMHGQNGDDAAPTDRAGNGLGRASLVSGQSNQ